jgi:hypothetical protein
VVMNSSIAVRAPCSAVASFASGAAAEICAFFQSYHRQATLEQ